MRQLLLWVAFVLAVLPARAGTLNLAPSGSTTVTVDSALTITGLAYSWLPGSSCEDFLVGAPSGQDIAITAGTTICVGSLKLMITGTISGSPVVREQVLDVVVADDPGLDAVVATPAAAVSVVRAHSTQTGAIQEWYDKHGDLVGDIDAEGKFSIYGYSGGTTTPFRVYDPDGALAIYVNNTKTFVGSSAGDVEIAPAGVLEINTTEVHMTAPTQITNVADPTDPTHADTQGARDAGIAAARSDGSGISGGVVWADPTALHAPTTGTDLCIERGYSTCVRVYNEVVGVLTAEPSIDPCSQSQSGVFQAYCY